MKKESRSSKPRHEDDEFDILDYAIEERPAQILWGKQLMFFATIPVDMIESIRFNPDYRRDVTKKKNKNITKSLGGKFNGESVELDTLGDYPLIQLPILSRRGIIIDGEGRIASMIQLGYKYIPCVIHNFRDDETEYKGFCFSNISDVGKNLTTHDLLQSVLDFDIPIEKVPSEGVRKDYQKACALFGKDYVHNTVLKTKGSLRSLSMSCFAFDKWIDEIGEKPKTENALLRLNQRFHTWFRIKGNAESFRALNAYKANTPIRKHVQLILDAVKQTSVLEKNNTTNYQLAIDNNGEWVITAIQKPNSTKKDLAQKRQSRNQK